MMKVEDLFPSPEYLVEMANLTPDQTGVGGLVIRISTQEAAHGPRVKVYRKPGKNSPCAIVVVEDGTSHVLHDNIDLSSREERESISFANKNFKALSDFWWHGDEWTAPEVRRMEDSLLKANRKGKDDELEKD